MERQRVEEMPDALALVFVRRLRAVVQPLRGEAEFLQWLGIQFNDNRLVAGVETGLFCERQIVLVGEAVKAHPLRQFVVKETAVVDVFLPLSRVRRAAQRLFAVLAAPAGQKADAGGLLEAHDEVAVIAVFGAAVVVGERREFQAPGQFHHHLLPRPRVAVGCEHRRADGIAHRVGFGNRAVEQRDGVVTLQVGRVRQHQVGEAHHLRVKGVNDDQKRYPVFAAGVLRLQHLAHARGVHRRVPGHVGHEHHQRVHRVGVAVDGVGDDHVHQAVVGERRVPRIGLVYPQRLPVFVHREVFGAGREAERRRRQRLPRLGAGRGFQRRRDVARERRLGAVAAGAVNRAQQHLQEVNRAAGVKAVRVRRNAAHRVHGHGAANELVVFAPGKVGPFALHLNGLAERDLRHFKREAFDDIGADAAHPGGVGGRVARVEVFFGEQREHGFRGFAARRRVFAEQRRLRAGAKAVGDRARRHVPHLRAAFAVAANQAVALLAGLLRDQVRRVGVANQEFPVKQLAFKQHMDHGQRQHRVGAGLDGQPLVGDGLVAGAHRVDGDELAAAPLQFFKADLDRVGRMILGHAPQHEVFGALPVGVAEFPERMAQRVKPRRRHVDRAETAVRGPVDGAELLRPQPGQRLHLVAAREIGEFFRVGGADFLKARGEDVERALPGDFLKLAVAAFGAGLAQQRRAQFRRRHLLHDAGVALRAQHAAVDGVVGVALDETDFVVLQRHLDAAAARAHVTGGVFHLLRRVVLKARQHGAFGGAFGGAFDGAPGGAFSNVFGLGRHEFPLCANVMWPRGRGWQCITEKRRRTI